MRIEMVKEIKKARFQQANKINQLKCLKVTNNKLKQTLRIKKASKIAIIIKRNSPRLLLH